MYVQIIISSLVYSCLYPKCMFYPPKKLYCQSKFCFNYLLLKKCIKYSNFLDIGEITGKVLLYISLNCKLLGQCLQPTNTRIQLPTSTAAGTHFNHHNSSRYTFTSNYSRRYTFLTSNHHNSSRYTFLSTTTTAGFAQFYPSHQHQVHNRISITTLVDEHFYNPQQCLVRITDFYPVTAVGMRLI